MIRIPIGGRQDDWLFTRMSWTRHLPRTTPASSQSGIWTRVTVLKSSALKTTRPSCILLAQTVSNNTLSERSPVRHQIIWPKNTSITVRMISLPLFVVEKWTALKISVIINWKARTNYSFLLDNMLFALYDNFSWLLYAWLRNVQTFPHTFVCRSTNPPSNHKCSS